MPKSAVMLKIKGEKKNLKKNKTQQTKKLNFVLLFPSPIASLYLQRSQLCTQHLLGSIWDASK